MLFEAEALEQASGESIARWRARRYAPFDRVADLCCGIGGDTLALAGVAWTAGVDRDGSRLALAVANARSLGLADHCAFIQGCVPSLRLRVAAAFADPDRRPGGSRTRRLEQMQPSLRQLLEMDPPIQNLGVKLSPALDEAELTATVAGRRCEVELISEDGVCKEAVLWLGGLVTTSRRASVLPAGGTLTDADPVESALRPPGAYVLEPDAAVIRAHLLEQAAAALGAWRLDAQVALLGTDRAIASPLARCYRVRETMAPNIKEIGRRLRADGYGNVVIKRRAAAVEPESVWKQLRHYLDPESAQEAVVLITRLGERRVAFLCEAVRGVVGDSWGG
jgi:hypothetical protein